LGERKNLSAKTVGMSGFPGRKGETLYHAPSAKSIFKRR